MHQYKLYPHLEMMRRRRMLWLTTKATLKDMMSSSENIMPAIRSMMPVLQDYSLLLVRRWLAMGLSLAAGI